MAVAVGGRVAGLSDLVPLLRQACGFAEVESALMQGDSASIDGAWGSACALVAAALACAGSNRLGPGRAALAGSSPSSSQAGEPPLLVVLPRISEVDDFSSDLAGFLGEAPLLLPAWETAAADGAVSDGVLAGRIATLLALREPWKRSETAAPELAQTQPAPHAGSRAAPGGKLSRMLAARQRGALAPPSTGPTRRVVVASIAALLQPVPTPEELAAATRTLRVGEQIEPLSLTAWLVEHGFENVPGVELPGEFSLHGGIVDLFPHAASDPVRIEFFGDQIESLRRFDASTQRKIEDLQSVMLMVAPPRAASEAAPPERAAAGQRAHDPVSGPPSRGSGHLVDWLPTGSWIALVDLPELREEGKHYLARLDNPRGYFSVEATLGRCVERPTVTVAGLSADGYETSCHLRIESVERFGATSSTLAKELERFAGPGEQALVACHNAGERQRLEELLAESGLVASGRVVLCEGQLLRGFRLVEERLLVLSDHELFGRREVRRQSRRARQAQLETRAIDSFLELAEGDLVVHVTKGIGRFLGMRVLQKDQQQEEHLALEFRDQAKVFVPASLIHLVQKYVGGSQAAPQLSKIGTTSWQRKKQQVAEAVADLAADMIALQAARAAKPGIPFPPDSHWQEAFEAAFPYEETADQIASIAAVKQDMQQPRPMDRLICGDVGYGKTEVAMRAAFKAIDAGKQVAVLVPTTVLAEQHFRTFRERMAEYPFQIEVLSRFRSKTSQRQILEQLERGAIDLVIGTHRLVQPDVRFHDLGLLIIDEEQRFGVEAKETLKKLKLEVDVLTLSATPIPRTLHLALLGIRDISNLQTPPQDRLSVETRISRFDEGLIRQAMVRELNRGGQAYFVHNRVYSIESIADTLQAIVPEARIGIVHGQMGEHQLEETMVAFVNGQIDLLVATTIIESGLDIPNANTIFIHQADKYGLADMHQLRGRVGRYKHRAYCYLLLEKGQSLTSTAARRLKAIEEFSELGAGFKIAMRDLEIRGAGNILGTEQSGHIASVGYELYCQLLENAVRRLKNLPLREPAHVAIDLPVAAFLPGSYVPPGRHKIEIYRKLARVETPEQLFELEAEMQDRFGPLPELAQNMVELRRVALLARNWQVDDLHLERGDLVLGYRRPDRIKALAARLAGRLRIVDGRNAYVAIPEGFATGGKLLTWLKALLHEAAV
jgi:transcription-repair coupling factor (superfamily II helicase)